MLDCPHSPLPLHSPLYIDRPPLETIALKSITEVGSLIRIKAPRKMGKSSLLVHMAHRAKSLGYEMVYLDFRQTEQQIYDSLERLLRWLCANTSQQLCLSNKLSEFWDEDLGPKMSASLYFQAYLLPQVHTPIVLVLNDISQIFEYPHVAGQFLSLIRYWHEQAKHQPIFEKLRLVLLYSTDIYLDLNLQQSPFNVGTALELPPFTVEQILDLADRYQLSQIGFSQAQDLLTLVGGHPYLVQLACAALKQQQPDWSSFVQKSVTQSGVYREHLQYLWSLIHSDPALHTALKTLLKNDEIQLAPNIAYKLYGMGLVSLDGNVCRFSCSLYQQYLSSYSDPCIITIDYEQCLEQLRQENQHLKNLVNIDGLTRLANRFYFDQYCRQTWDRLIEEQQPLSLLMVDIDYFKAYNDTYGHQQGDRCLRDVAITLRQVVVAQDIAGLAARYGGEEFAVVLPNSSGMKALNIAMTICSAVRALIIKHHKSQVPCQSISVSIGLATVLPSPQQSLEALIEAADQALYQAKHQGRDQVVVSPILFNEPFDSL